MIGINPRGTLSDMAKKKVTKRKRGDSFPDRLRNAVDDSGLSWYSIARDAKIGQSTIKRFMHSQGNPTFELAEKIAAVLGLRIELIHIK